MKNVHQPHLTGAIVFSLYREESDICDTPRLIGITYLHTVIAYLTAR